MLHSWNHSCEGALAHSLSIEINQTSHSFHNSKKMKFQMANQAKSIHFTIFSLSSVRRNVSNTIYYLKIIFINRMSKQQLLSFEMLELPITKNNQNSPPPQPAQKHRPKKHYRHSLSHIKIIILTTLALLFCFYRVLYWQKDKTCLVDMLHEWTTEVNLLLNQNNLFYQVMLITAQQSIQINIFLLSFISTFKVNNLKAHLFIGLFYGIRGILLNIERFPYPPHIIWNAPIIPSFTVPYGITRDYFYSGHTGLMLFCTFWWKHLGYNYLYIFSLVLTPVVILVLLASRVHYSIDIIAAFIFTFWLQRHVLRYVAVFDRLFGFVLIRIHKAFDILKSVFV